MKGWLLPGILVIAGFSFAQSPLDSEEEISIGGIKQFITIRATDSTLPVLLFLHGGPGGSVMSYADKFTDRLAKHFIVVQWDQRETGRTLELNRSPLPLNVSVFQNDTEEIVRYLLKRFGRDKIYLAGHSWGTALAFHMAGKHPELLHACIVIGPMIHQQESEKRALAIMQREALQENNKQAVRELAKVRIPFENGEQLYYHRKWLLARMGGTRQLSKSYVQSWATTWLSVFNEASRDNLFSQLPAIACPVYFFAGRRDIQTSSELAMEYHNVLKAPRKGFYWFETGHSIPNASPGRLQDLIIEVVLPETFALQNPGGVISTQ